MSARDLCKLDGQSPSHIGAGQKPDGPRDRAGMLNDLSVRPFPEAIEFGTAAIQPIEPIGVRADQLAPVPTTAPPATVASPGQGHSPYPDPAPVSEPLSWHETDRWVRNLRRAQADGLISEERMLDHLAQRFGGQRVDLGLTPPDPELAPLFDPALCLRLQCMPWRASAETLWIATARPEDFEDACRQLTADRPIRFRLRPVLAPRVDVQGHLARLHRDHLTERMTQRTASPFSARHWPTPSTLATVAAVTAVAAVLWMLGIATISWMLTAVAVLSVGIASALKVAAALTHLSRPGLPMNTSPPPDNAPLPIVSILVPLYHETEIAQALLKRLARLEYPSDRLDILLVLEESDTMTRQAIGAAHLPPWMQIVVVPDGQPRTKPRAMNYALDFAAGEIIGVYDAEDAPDPDQILKVVSTFATEPKSTACLQGALDYYNPDQTWITRCFTVEYNTWFRLLMPGMAKLGFAVPLGGTTIFLRRDPLERVGAWDAHNVTEDADLGMRLARFGYRTRVIDTTTGEEASARPMVWIRQRSRWLKGYLMTYAVHMRRPFRLLRDLGPWQFIGFQAHFLTAILHFALAPFLWVYWLLLFGFALPLSTSVLWPGMQTAAISLIGFELLIMVLGIVGTWRPEHRHLWIWVPSLHLYWPMGCLAMWKALYELAANPFYWDKTPHGHSAHTKSEARAQPHTPLRARIAPPMGRVQRKAMGQTEKPTTAYSTMSTPPESSLRRVTNALEM